MTCTFMPRLLAFFGLATFGSDSQKGFTLKGANWYVKRWGEGVGGSSACGANE